MSCRVARFRDLPSGWTCSSGRTVDPQPDERPPALDDTPDADLVGPDDPARARRLPWAEFFKRVFREDVLVCRRCGGEMRLIAVIEDPAVIEKILRHLRRWERGPPRGRHAVVESADHESPHSAD
jgi:hypothetical protein